MWLKSYPALGGERRIHDITRSIGLKAAPPQTPRWPISEEEAKRYERGLPYLELEENEITLNRIDRIRTKLNTLGSYDIDACAGLDLGITKHRFRVAPPLPETEASAFEERYGIKLPPEYREFITSVGSSGAGPYCGLLPVTQAAEHLDCDDEATCKRMLGAAFPLSDKVYQPDWKLGQEDWLVEVGGANWKERRYGPESWSPFQGTMAICDQGCTYYAVLVLNGPERGAIWNIELHLSPPQKAPYPGFLDYYEDWVDRMLAKEKQFWYGYPRIQQSQE